MMRKTQIKQTALVLTLVYLFLSGFIMVGAGGHAAHHSDSADHAAQHASFICNWMCAASTFVQSANPRLSQRLTLSFENLAGYADGFYGIRSVISFYIRPPPVSVS
ncbi:MAG: hypothetical protein HY204_02630 [Nitrospirae bacterium]|nr:hypothetical protein [Nitrospirota bacterium]